MPRAATQASTIRRWIREHRAQLPGKDPHLQQLLMLAQSMDADLEDKGRVQAAHSTAFRALMADLEAALTPPEGSASRGEQPEDDALFGVAGGELVE